MSLGDLLRQFKGKRALVVGDLMVDEYLFCNATRISPEAPVMVVRHSRTERLPGGAANVARNLKSLGAEVQVIGIAGEDRGATLLEEAMTQQGLSPMLIRDPERETTRKVRVLADATHQALRIDFEADDPISTDLEEKLLNAVDQTVRDVDVVILSDYVKGCLTPTVIHHVVDSARKHGVKVVANAKPKSLKHYRGATLVSVNRLEATEALGLPRLLDPESATQPIHELRSNSGVEQLLVTLGDKGMLAVSVKETVRLPARKIEVFDTAGAGDTVIATVALGMATAGFDESVFRLAIETSACVVRHVGVATPSQEDLAAIAEL
ncbi:MAG TPA: PfkB family carbohydrate kinase [Fimbriimonadaceae bacterium]|nr:PfkB family carbohydrate kinase [Fimbriimonadaceae bacterium]